MKNIIYYIIFIILILISYVIFKIFTFSTESDDLEKRYREAFFKTYKIFAVEIPDKVDFAGDTAPLHKYYVRESLDQELLRFTYNHSTTLLLFKRANRWFPIIEPILKKNNIPSDFKYLALIESYFENNVSHMGAAGFWQFVKQTAIKYDLEVNDEVDERFNVEKSTEAACRYIKYLYSLYRNWSLVAAAYNMGETALSSVIGKQKVDNYHDLYLNYETGRYVYRILAMKIIYQKPHNYGFYLTTKDLYPPIPVEYVEVDSTVSDLAQFAISKNINLRILKELNPWLRKNQLTNNERKKYLIKLPLNGNIDYFDISKDIDNEEVIDNSNE